MAARGSTQSQEQELTESAMRPTTLAGLGSFTILQALDQPQLNNSPNSTFVIQRTERFPRMNVLASPKEAGAACPAGGTSLTQEEEPHPEKAREEILSPNQRGTAVQQTHQER